MKTWKEVMEMTVDECEKLERLEHRIIELELQRAKVPNLEAVVVEITRLDLRPGEVLIVRVPEEVAGGAQELRWIQEVLDMSLQDSDLDNRVLVMPMGFEVSIAKANEAPGPEDTHT